ncbi:MAG: hypothetical protein JWN40_2243 [Phycisphaerales bacterium]|nr:hypothetical protein [Phycisphaerales bacterium]
MTPPQKQKPRTLDYQPLKDSRRDSAEIVLRGVVGGVFCLLFLVWGRYEWLVIDRGQSHAGTLLEPSILLSFIGAVFCLLIALGFFRR